MSFDAIRWAMAQTIQKSSAKFLLVAMADCVNEKAPEMVCWPSVAHLSTTTSQDRKTVLAGMKYLAQAGFITDTGTKVGQTKQIAVYLLKTPEIGTIPASEQSQISLETVPVFQCDKSANSTGFGTVEQAQKRDSTETGTVPDFPSNSTVFPSEQSQISLETVPKTGHGTSKEPVMEPVMEPVKKKRASATSAFALNEIPGIAPELFADFLTTRKAKNAGPLTATALKGIQREAGKAGISLVDAITFCCERGWQGFNAGWYANSIARSAGGTSESVARQDVRSKGKHSGFDDEYYKNAEQWA